MAPAGNVFAADQIDRGIGILYDRQTTAAGSTTALVYNYFTQPIGGTKTKSDTNLLQGNRIPPPQAFVTSAIGFVFAATMLLADAAGFLKNYYHEFKIGSKGVFAEGPLQLFPGGAGLTGALSTNHATASLQSMISNGDPSMLAVRRFPDYPRLIPQNVYFGLNVISGASTVTLAATVASTIVSPAYGGLDVLAYLDGIWDREVS
jgi:hypothetical protein